MKTTGKAVQDELVDALKAWERFNETQMHKDLLEAQELTRTALDKVRDDRSD